MRIEGPIYVRQTEDEDEPWPWCTKEEADMTQFAFTAVLANGQEYGLMFTSSDIVDEPPSYMLEAAERALEEYREQHEQEEIA